jgi:hypothetical protein
MTTIQQLLDLAGSQVGYAEASNNDNKFGAWYGANNVPWCAEYVSWAFYTAFHANGQPSPLEGIQNAKGFAYTPLVVAWSRKNSTWRPDPAPGRLALYDWNGDGKSDHIGICASGEDGSGNFTALEGNTSTANQNNGGEVMRRTRSNHKGYCLGFVDLSASFVPTAETVVTAAATDVPAWPGRVLLLSSPNMRGEDVSTWQRQMKARGWSIEVDGLFGKGSDSVARRFQTEKHLVVDGQVGSVTWLASWTAPL